MSNKQKAIPEIIVNSTPQSFEAEQFRILRTSIALQTKKQKIDSILITSPSEAEGKTTTAVNLAAVFAEEGKKVLLVDGDMRNPAIHKIFHKSNTHGLASVLMRQLSIKDAIQSSFIPGLKILTSGPVPLNSVKLLGSGMLETFIATSTVEFDLLIFDSPPVLSYSDAQLLADKCQYSVLVINTKETERNLAVKAKTLLDLTESKLLGAVLNKTIARH